MQRCHTTIEKSGINTQGELSGHIIVLTGGADGIGRECASAYVREGAVVVLVDRDGDKAAMAAAAVFLLSQRARFITGCALPVSGGAELGYRR